MDKGMNKTHTLCLMIAFFFICAAPAQADVGVTDACQDEIRELEDKIDDNKDEYTDESRREARRELAAAKTNRLNPTKCRANIIDARQALQRGRIDKRKE